MTPCHISAFRQAQSKTPQTGKWQGVTSAFTVLLLIPFVISGQLSSNFFKSQQLQHDKMHTSESYTKKHMLGDKYRYSQVLSLPSAILSWQRGFTKQCYKNKLVCDIRQTLSLSTFLSFCTKLRKVMRNRVSNRAVWALVLHITFLGEQVTKLVAGFIFCGFNHLDIFIYCKPK